jgi:hypothetical protein
MKGAAMRRIVLPVVTAVVLLVTACSDDPEEDVVGDTGTTPSASTSPQPETPGPEGTVWRWANVTVTIPDGSGISVSPGTAALAGLPGTLILTKINPDDPERYSFVSIDAITGDMVERSVLAEDEALIDSVLATVSLGPLDPETAGWPYQQEPAPDMPRLSEASVSYVHPSPDSGMYVGFGLGDPGGPFLDIRNERSAAFVRIGSDGSLEFDTTMVIEEDLPVFERWLAEVRRCGVEMEC